MKTPIRGRILAALAVIGFVVLPMAVATSAASSTSILQPAKTAVVSDAINVPTMAVATVLTAPAAITVDVIQAASANVVNYALMLTLVLAAIMVPVALRRKRLDNTNTRTRLRARDHDAMKKHTDAIFAIDTGPQINGHTMMLDDTMHIDTGPHVDLSDAALAAFLDDCTMEQFAGVG